MQVRTKLYISLSAAILFAIAVIVFFINGNPQNGFGYVFSLRPLYKI
ncbi:hypothetical protein [Bacillus sp. COPE52]|nr:hypothetical protein [Bacillus sp. COPE52]